MTDEQTDKQIQNKAKVVLYYFVNIYLSQKMIVSIFPLKLVPLRVTLPVVALSHLASVRSLATQRKLIMEETCPYCICE